MRALQRVIADEWPSKVWFVSAIAAGAWFTIAAFDPTLSDILSWRFLVLFVPTSVAVLIVALGLSLIFGSVLVYPVYALQARLNGAPFAVGDRVRVISRRERGRISQVYSAWQGNTVRIDLGEEAREKFDDIFGWHQIERVAETSLPSN